MRFVAPLAIVAFVIAFIVVVSSSGGGGSSSGGSSTGSATRTSGSTTTTGTGKRSKSHRRTYTVRAGDTLGAIAIKTGVSVSTLESLNPGLDPQGLVAGQKLKLRE
ncbi:MAG TPA: LysM domain-containing protein [Thermoleophilaceae bacterium]